MTTPKKVTSTTVHLFNRWFLADVQLVPNSSCGDANQVLPLPGRQLISVFNIGIHVPSRLCVSIHSKLEKTNVILTQYRVDDNFICSNVHLDNYCNSYSTSSPYSMFKCTQKAFIELFDVLERADHSNIQFSPNIIMGS